MFGIEGPFRGPLYSSHYYDNLNHENYRLYLELNSVKAFGLYLITPDIRIIVIFEKEGAREGSVGRAGPLSEPVVCLADDPPVK